MLNGRYKFTTSCERKFDQLWKQDGWFRKLWHEFIEFCKILIRKAKWKYISVWL